jgi:hypothetical protein
MSWNEGFEGRIGAPRLKHKLEYGSCGSDTNSDFLHFWQLQAAGCRASICSICFLCFPIATPTKSGTRPSFARQFSLRVPGCGPCAAFFRPAHFRGSLWKFAPSGGRRHCGRCRLCSRTGEIAFGSPHLAEFSGQLAAFSVLFFLWCTLYFSIKQWQQAAHAREQLAP